jgi:hypothetical protein
MELLLFATQRPSRKTCIPVFNDLSLPIQGPLNTLTLETIDISEEKKKSLRFLKNPRGPPSVIVEQ